MLNKKIINIFNNIAKVYQNESYAVQVRTKITLGLLISFCFVSIIAFSPSLLFREGSKVTVLIILLITEMFFISLIVLLYRGHRELVNSLFSIGLFGIIISTYLTGAPDYTSTQFIDRFCAVAIMQTAMSVLISEKRRYLFFTFIAYSINIIIFAFFQKELIEISKHTALLGSYIRDIVILLVSFLSLILIHTVTHKTIQSHAKSEEALQKLNKELEKKVMERTQSLLLIEKKNSINILLAGINHQFNTPIGNILTASSALQENSDKIDKSTLDKSLKLIADNANKLSLIVETINQISYSHKNDQKLLNNIYSLVEGLYASLAHRFEKENIRFRIESEQNFVVNISSAGIVQILTILIINAIDHGFAKESPSAREIWVRLQRGEQNLIVDVGNTGDQIPSDFQNKIFEAFYTTNHQAGNSGLGLYIAANIAHTELAGNLQLVKSDRESTIFQLVIPLEKNSF